MKFDNETKEKIHYAVSISAFLIGIILCIVDFVIPPPGEIHNTSLWFLGEMMAFVGAVFGISLHYNGELKNFKQEIIRQINGK